jgi:4-amino-4-deoxy-L-arabinose transferase-like glycosyltransferase
MYLTGNAPDFTTFVAAQMQNLAGVVGAMRLAPVVMTSLSIAGIYGLARPLLGWRAALLGAGLLAVDPFFVAHSCIVNGDALSAALMLMALLAFARLWQTKNRAMIGLAGVLAGLAVLTKLPAPIILPMLLIPALPGFGPIRNGDFGSSRW